METNTTAKTKKQSRTSGAFVGRAGHMTLHIVAVLFLIYSAYHGIHATTTYRAATGLGNIAGIVGIIAIEATMLAIYLAWVNHKINGAAQQVAAGVTYAVGFIFACLGIIGDSQMQAGVPLTPWIATYLTTILPAAPAVMSVGAFITVMLGPEATRQRNAAEDEQDILEEEHELALQLRRAEATAAAQLRALELDTKLALAAQMKQYVSSPAAQAAIIATAERDAPAMLRALGIHMPGSPNELPEPAQPTPPQQRGGVTVPDLQDLIDRGILFMPDHTPIPIHTAAHPNGHKPVENGKH